MERRIAAATTHSKLLEDLVSPVPGEDYPLFETKQKALMFAAGVGAHLGHRTPLASRDGSTAIRFDIFEKALDDGFVYCLAIKDSQGLGILSEAREEELAQIFEEYAHSGLVELHRRVIGEAEPLQTLIHMMTDARYPLVEEGLEGLESDLLAGLLRR